MSVRDEFLSALFTGPLLRADAVVVLAGEDAEPRASVASELLKQQAAQWIVITGGKHEPPRWLGADAVHATMLGTGIAPSRFIVDTSAMHTQQQAVYVAGLCAEREWKQILLVASSYHLPRAFLTFIKALPDTTRVVPVPCSQSKWSESPAGMLSTRRELLQGDLAKIAQYTDHCATEADGLEYLLRWEGQ